MPSRIYAKIKSSPIKSVLQYVKLTCKTFLYLRGTLGDDPDDDDDEIETMEESKMIERGEDAGLSASFDGVMPCLLPPSDFVDPAEVKKVSEDR